MGTCKTPDSQNTFEEYAFENQQNPFLYCKDCRDKKRAEKESGGGYQGTQNASPTALDPKTEERHKEIMNALRELYSLMEDVKRKES